ncbi:unnamed protein product [Pedinophyceae sp. YPF-701]|nr:unnamed protein product [Pedinophyceae sp. YPF-701]
MDRVLDTIDRSGILAGVATEGRRPAIMLDVDNTLVFWIRHDAAEDPYGDAQPIQATIDFLVRRCLPDEGGDPAQYECYLVTARTCGEGVGRALAKNLQDAVGDGMTQEWLKERLLFVGSLMGCHSWEHTAIKDLARAWLEEHRNVRFVMSVGDQDTDIFGEHSGVKVKLQNAAYDARDVSAHRYTWEPEAGQYPDDGDTWRKFCSLEKAFVRSAPDFCYENALASGGFVDDISLARCMDCDPSRGEDECTLWLGDPDEDRRRHHHAGEDAFYGLASALAFMVVVVVISLAIVSLFMVATSWFASSRPRPPQPDILGSLLIPGEPLHPIGENSPAQYHEGVWRGSSAAETGAAAQLAGDGAPAEVEALLMTTLEGAGERGVARRELEAGLGAEHGAERFEYALQGLVDRGIAAEANGVVQLMM